MNELIDSIISLLYILKYGPIINKRRDFKRKMNLYAEICGDDAYVYRNYAMGKISRIKVKPYSEGVPKYAIFEKYSDTTRVFILNENIEFMYRIENYTCIDRSFYIKLNDELN